MRYAALAVRTHLSFSNLVCGYYKCASVFFGRNSCIVNTFAIDLHGMHVEEALLYVQRTIKDFKEHMEKWPCEFLPVVGHECLSTP